MGKPSDDLSDDFVASLLSKEATEKNIRYSSLGLQAFPPKRSTSNAPKPNTRFLRNIIREADSHNAALLAKEAEESKERLRIMRMKERAGHNGESSSVGTNGEGSSSRAMQRPDRELYRVGGRREVLVVGEGRRRQSRSRGQETPVTEERKRRHSRSREYTEGRKRRRSRSSERSRSRSPDRERRRHRKRSRSRERRRSGSRSRKHRYHSSRHHGSKDRDTSKHRDQDRDRDQDRSRDQDRGKDDKPSSSSTTSHTSKPRHHSPPHRRPESSRSRSRRRKRRKEMEMDSPPPSSPHSSSSDPLASIIGPAPPAPPPRARGRGTVNGASAMDARFSADYDPSLDVRPDSDMEGDDWDNALEAFRDRQKWKALGAERLRSAGFAEDFITAWESGDVKNSANIKWAKEGVREWDRGKVVEDGEVKVRAPWAMGGEGV